MEEELCPDCDGKRRLKQIIFWAFKEFGETMDMTKLLNEKDDRVYFTEVVKFIEHFVDVTLTQTQNKKD